MKEFQKKKRIRRILYSPIVLLLLAIFLVLLLRSTWTIYKKDKLSNQNLDIEKLELQKLVNREENLAASLDYLKTDQGIENEIRSKFRAVKEDEKVAVIVDDQISTTSTTTTTQKGGFWYNLFH